MIPEDRIVNKIIKRKGFEIFISNPSVFDDLFDRFIITEKFEDQIRELAKIEKPKEVSILMDALTFRLVKHIDYYPLFYNNLPARKKKNAPKHFILKMFYDEMLNPINSAFINDVYIPSISSVKKLQKRFDSTEPDFIWFTPSEEEQYIRIYTNNKILFSGNSQDLKTTFVILNINKKEKKLEGFNLVYGLELIKNSPFISILNYIKMKTREKLISIINKKEMQESLQSATVSGIYKNKFLLKIGGEK